MSGSFILQIEKVLESTIWKIVVDQASPRIFLELRDPDKKQVSFWGVDLVRKKCVLENLTTEEIWWVSLEGVADDDLFITYYQNENNPDIKSLLCFDVKTRKLKWWKQDFSFEAVHSRHVIGRNNKRNVRILIESESGEEIQLGTDLEVLSYNFSVIRPFQYLEGTANFDAVKSFLVGKKFDVPIHVIEYVESNGFIFVSFFTEKPGQLKNFLLVFDSGGEIVLNETLGEHLKGIATDTFFIYAGSLIFVKNKNELVCYKIV